MNDSVEVARRLGAEHGTRAAEEWLEAGEPDRHLKQGWYPEAEGLPQPAVHKLDDWTMDRTEWVAWAVEYVAAFTAAVEATIRQAVQS